MNFDILFIIQSLCTDKCLQKLDGVLTYVFLNYVRLFVSLHHKVYYCINDQLKFQIFREGAKKTSCHKLGTFCQIFYAKDFMSDFLSSERKAPWKLL